MPCLHAYIDDSGKEGVSSTQVLAGYLATAEAWDEFSARWQEVLDQADLTNFHMVDAWRLSRPYQHLGALGRNQLITELLACIKKHAERAFVLSIDLEAYIHWFGRHEFKFQETRPYFFGFHQILKMITSYAYEQKYDCELKIYFDEQGGEPLSKIIQSVELHRIAAASRGRNNINIPTPRYISDDNCPPLQAADLLAWLSRREDHNHKNQANWEERAEKIWLDGALSVPNEVELLGDRELEARSNIIADEIRRFEGRTQ